MNLHWPFTSSKRRAGCARRRRANDRLLAHLRPRTLRLEAAERRLLLSHTAPLLNPNDTAVFYSPAVDMALAANTGETVSAMLATGGPIVDNQPLGGNFLSLDTNDGAQEGIAITALFGASNGAWEYSLNSGTSWSILSPAVTAANALRLAGGDLLRFLPNEGFSGSAGISFAAWDLTDGAQHGTTVDLSYAEASGGGTAYSTATATATLQVASLSPPALVSTIAATPVAQTGNLTEQDLFMVGSDGLVRGDRYAYSPHADTGLAVIDPTTIFPANAPLTAYSDGTSINVFGVASNGDAMWNQYTAGGGWTGFMPLNGFIPGATATFASGTGLVGAAEPGLLNLFALGSNGYVQQYTYTSSTGQWTLTSLDSHLSLPAYPTGAKLAAWDSLSTVSVFGVLSDGAIQQLKYTAGSWAAPTPYISSQLAAGTQLSVVGVPDVVDLFGVDPNGYLDVIDYSYTGNPVGGENGVVGGYAPSVPVGVAEDTSNEPVVFGVETSGSILEAYISNGAWNSQSNYAYPPFAATGLAAYADPSSVIQVFGQTTSGGLADEEQSGSGSNWGEYTLGAAAQNSIAGGQVARSGNFNEQDLLTVGGDGLVRLDRYYSGSHTDSGLALIDPNTIFAVGAPLTAFSSGGTTYVFGVTQNGTLVWNQGVPGGWWSHFQSIDNSISAEPVAAAVENGRFYIFAVGMDGYVRQYTYTSGAWSGTVLNNLPAVGRGAPLAVWDSGWSIDVFAVDSSRNVDQFHYADGYWTPTTAASNVPVL